MTRTRVAGRSRTMAVGVAAVVAAMASSASAPSPASGASAARGGERQTPTYGLLKLDVLINADIWAKRPEMMAAGLGFTSIIGVPGLSVDDLSRSERLVRAVGGAWNSISCVAGETPPLSAYTSASTPMQVANAYGRPAITADGLPVEFSWPIRPSTLDASDFQVTLNTGRRVVPELVSIYPNDEYNERSVAVLFGKFGNRIPSGQRGSEYPVLTRVVRDKTPLELVGPGGRIVSAVGFHARAAASPYDSSGVAPADRSGPHLIAAKLTRLSARGDDAPKPFRFALPNDGRALYGRRARFRLRVYTTGGFSPDGVRAVFPTEFSRYFRLHARGAHGRDTLLTRTGHDYRIAGHELTILGLADVGRKQQSYDDCYREDKDNYIDIILAGQTAAARRITGVEIPASGGYSPFFNPGGPGNDPSKGVRYTSPGPRQLQPVWVALENPMTVTYVHRAPSR